MPCKPTWVEILPPCRRQTCCCCRPRCGDWARCQPCCGASLRLGGQVLGACSAAIAPQNLSVVCPLRWVLYGEARCTVTTLPDTLGNFVGVIEKGGGGVGRRLMHVRYAAGLQNRSHIVFGPALATYGCGNLLYSCSVWRSRQCIGD